MNVIGQKFFYLFGYNWENNIIFRASKDMIKGFLNVKASGAFAIGVITGYLMWSFSLVGNCSNSNFILKVTKEE